ncbi:MAG: hypothetical protein JSR82_19070 [Verrucomicrobia bacterium]|nr:hypothetical protein [Verrucomicrobiota bacterium]
MSTLLRLGSVLSVALAFMALTVSSPAADQPPKDKEKSVKCTKCKDPAKCPDGCCETCSKPKK